MSNSAGRDLLMNRQQIVGYVFQQRPRHFARRNRRGPSGHKATQPVQHFPQPPLANHGGPGLDERQARCRSA